jgi:hypothetical protein
LKPGNRTLATFYAVLVVAASTQVAGATWDGIVHLSQPVDSFFSYPHLVVYCGAALGIAAVLAALFILANTTLEKEKLIGLKFGCVGAALLLIGGPFDFWWHRTLTQESFLILPFLSPPHMVIEAGIGFFMFTSLCGFYVLRQSPR